MSKEKYYFPKLESALETKGWTKEEFKQKARRINSKPGSRGWSELMKKSNGMTSVYVNKAKLVLTELEFADDVCEFVVCV